eukprot:SAG11_NODE_315_length_10858_cov_14.578977_2_plen_116_part_00
MTASDGLAPARCGGLLASLLTSRLAALGAGPAHTAAATERSFVAAEEALRVAQGQVSVCGGRHARATRRCGGRRGAAPRTRNSGGGAAGYCRVGCGEVEAAPNVVALSGHCLGQE